MWLLNTAAPTLSSPLSNPDWEDPDQRIVIWLADKGDRTSVSLAHQRMPDKATADAMKAFWRERLAALAAFVEERG